MDAQGRLVPVDDIQMWGSAASDVDRVEVLLENGGLVEAWVGGGVWLAWWNEPISAVAVRASDPMTGIDRSLLDPRS